MGGGGDVLSGHRGFGSVHHEGWGERRGRRGPTHWAQSTSAVAEGAAAGVC
ncbi:hypothetical protein FM106_08640 [Brachybacterium faecium]|nr:hypothetical protein FM106_08640 [Brachybacterium faecium]